MADPIPKYPLYDATYTAYRLSPLYHGSNILLDEITLRMHARRMRDILRGDILRGVDVGAAGSTDGNISGTLESCKWDLFGDEEAWEQLHRPDTTPDEQEEPGDLTDAPTLDPASARGVHIELRYQKAHYTALLLRDPAETLKPPTGFTSLPLLLVRMPAALRDTLTTYLAHTFDTRLAPLPLRSAFLAATLERLLANLANADDDDGSLLPSRLQLQLSFPSTPSLRSLDISLPRSDLPAFLHRGAAAPPPLAEKSSLVTGPLTSALARYLDAHLALDLAHPAVRLAKIALPPLLALSADGRVKLFSPDGGAVGRGVVDGVYGALVGAARGAVDAAAAVAVAVVVVGRGKKSGKGVDGEEVVVGKKAKAKAKGVAKGKKRALGVGDANAGRKGAGGKKRRVGRDESGEEEEEEEGDEAEEAEGDVDGAEEGDEDDGEEDVVAGAAGAGRRGRLSLPKEPPPPYELHDPARVAGGR